MNRPIGAGGGIWQKTLALFAAEPTKAFSAREIADAIDFEPFEVRGVLCAKAKLKKVVRVVSVESGPLRWRLPQEPSQ